MKEYEIKLNEFEILTLREGLFKCFRDDLISQKDLEQIDNKFKECFK